MMAALIVTVILDIKVVALTSHVKMVFVLVTVLTSMNALPELTNVTIELNVLILTEG